jgi:hypothetical protein
MNAKYTFIITAAILATYTLSIGIAFFSPHQAEAIKNKYCTSTTTGGAGEFPLTECYKTLDQCEQARQQFIAEGFITTPCSKTKHA